jgi:hypothetical protein
MTNHTIGQFGLSSVRIAMRGERDVAKRTAHLPTAASTDDRSRKTSPIKQNHRLFAAFDCIKQFPRQALAEDGQIAARIFGAHIDHLDIGHPRVADSLRKIEKRRESVLRAPIR